jgi:hypothetical protein
MLGTSAFRDFTNLRILARRIPFTRQSHLIAGQWIASWPKNDVPISKSP